MGRVAESTYVDASVAEVWELYFEPRAWPAWVDGFAAVESSDGYPRRGGVLRWRSTPAGRGEVVERVLEHEPRTLHRVAFADPETEGELETRFAVESGVGGEPGTRVAQTLTYRLRDAGVLTLLTDPIFIRPQIARSVRRSLDALGIEAEQPRDV